MEKFWRAAIGIAGLGAVAFFVFYSLYNQWLSLPIFPVLTQEQAFILMLAFLGFTFLSLITGVVGWLFHRPHRESEDASLHRLEQAWDEVNYIDCEKLIGPDVNRAARALDLTSLYWRNGYISKSTLIERHGRTFCELFRQLDSCNKIVPGFEKLKKHCRDFLPALVRETYEQVKAQIKE